MLITHLKISMRLQMRCSETDLLVSFWRRTNGRKILVFALWLATLSEKTDAPRFPLGFPHILRDFSRILFTFRLFTKVKRGDGILPYFLWEVNSTTFGLWNAHPSLKFDWKGSPPCLSIAVVLHAVFWKGMGWEFFNQASQSLYVVQQICAAPFRRQI